MENPVLINKQQVTCLRRRRNIAFLLAFLPLILIQIEFPQIVAVFLVPIDAAKKIPFMIVYGIGWRRQTLQPQLSIFCEYPTPFGMLNIEKIKAKMMIICWRGRFASPYEQLILVIYHGVIGSGGRIVMKSVLVLHIVSENFDSHYGLSSLFYKR